MNEVPKKKLIIFDLISSAVFGIIMFLFYITDEIPLSTALAKATCVAVFYGVLNSITNRWLRKKMSSKK